MVSIGTQTTLFRADQLPHTSYRRRSRIVHNIPTRGKNLVRLTVIIIRTYHVDKHNTPVSKHSLVGRTPNIMKVNIGTQYNVIMYIPILMQYYHYEVCVNSGHRRGRDERIVLGV